MPTLAIILMVSQFALIRNDAAIIDLTLDLRNKVILGAISAFLSLGAATLAVRHFGLGIPGLCFGFMAGRSVLSIAYPFMVGRRLGIPASAQLGYLARPACVGTLLMVGAFALGERWITESWLGLVAGAGTTAALVLVVAFYAGVPAELRPSFAGRARGMLARGRSRS